MNLKELVASKGAFSWQLLNDKQLAYASRIQE